MPGPGAGPAPGSAGEKIQDWFGKPATKAVLGAVAKIEAPFLAVTAPIRSKAMILGEEAKTEPASYDGLAKWSAAIGLNIAAGAVDVATFNIRPDIVLETAKGIGTIVTTPGSLGDIKETIAADPVKFLAEAVGSVALGGAITGAVKTHAPSIKRGTIEIPTVGGGTIEWKGFYLDYGKRTTRLTGGLSIKDATGKILSSGDDQVKILSQLDGKYGFVPQTQIETQVTIAAMKKLGFSPSELQKVKDVRAILSRTSGTQSKFIDEFLPAETGTLGEAGISEFKQFLGENADDFERIYGSYASKSQLKTDVEFRLVDKPQISGLRKPGDIDIVLSGSAEEAQDFIKRLSDRLKGVGETVRVESGKPLMIQADVGSGKWAHAIDGHLAGAPTLDAVFPQQWGFMVEQAAIKIEGISVQSLGEQSIRKGTAILGFADDAVLGPTAWRSKDIVDFIQVSQTLEESRPFFTRSVQSNIDRVKTLYGVEGIANVKNIMETPGKVGTTMFVPRPSSGVSAIAKVTPISGGISNMLSYSPGVSSPASVKPSPGSVLDISSILVSSPFVSQKVTKTSSPSIGSQSVSVSSILSYSPSVGSRTQTKRKDTKISPLSYNPIVDARRSVDVKKKPKDDKRDSFSSIISYSPLSSTSKPPSSFKISPPSIAPPSIWVPSPPSPPSIGSPEPSPYTFRLPPPSSNKTRTILDFDPRKKKKKPKKARKTRKKVEKRKTPLDVISWTPRM